MSNGQELDHLFVTVSMNLDGFNKAAESFTATFAKMEASVASFATKTESTLKRTTTSLETMSAALAATTTLINMSMSQANEAAGKMVSGKNGVRSLLTEIGGGLKDLGAGLSQVTQAKKLEAIGLGLGEISNHIGFFNDTRNHFKEIGHGLTALGTGLNAVTGVKKLEAIGQGLGEISNHITFFEDTRKHFKEIGGGLKDIGAAVAQYPDMAKHLRGIGVASGELEKFITTVAGAGNVSQTFRTLARSLGHVGEFLAASMSLKSGRLGAIVPELETFAKGFNAIANQLAGGNIESAAMVFGRVTNFMRASGKFTFDDKVFNAFGGWLTKTFDALSQLNPAGLQVAADMTGRMTGLVKAAGGVSSASIAMNTTPLFHLFGNITNMFGNMDQGKLTGGNTMLLRMGNLLKSVGSVNPQNISASFGAIVQGVQGLALVNANTAAQQIGLIAKLANAATKLSAINPAQLSGVSNALRGMLGGGGGGAGGGGVAGAMGGIPPAANAASMASARLNSSWSGLNATGQSLISTVNGMRLSFMGLAGFGLFKFASVDDTLVRTVARMENLGTSEPGVYQAFRRAAMSASGNSTSDVVSMTKALDTMASSGYSAGAAIDSLRLMENFAVVSGTKLEESTRKLIDAQVALGLTSEKNYDEHRKGLEQVSDMVVKAARFAGTTEGQMLDSFTGRLTGAMDRVKMSPQETVAALAMASRVSPTMRGAAGGDAVARAIAVLTKGAGTEFSSWQGLQIKGMEGAKFKGFSDMLIQLNKLAGTDTPKGLSQRKLLGIGEDQKTVHAIELLVKHGKAIADFATKLEEVNGITQRTADTIRESFLSQMKELWNNTVNVSSVIAESLIPAITSLVSPLSDAFRAFTDLIPAMQQFIVMTGAALVLFRPFVSLLSFGFGMALAPVRLLIGSMVSLVSWAISTTVAIGTYTAAAYTWITAKWAMVTASKTLASVLSVVRGAFVATGLAISTVYTAFRTGNAIALFGGMAFKAFAFVIDKVVIPALDAVEYAFTVIGNAAKVAWDATVYGAKAVLHAVELIQQMLEGSVTAFNAIGKALLATAVAAWQVFLSGLASVVSAVMTFATIAVPLFVLLPVVIGAITAPIITLGLGVYQLTNLVGTGLVKAWDAARWAASQSLGWVGSKVTQIGAAVQDMWRGMTKAASVFASQAYVALEYTAGLVWNYRQNWESFVEWLDRYGAQAFEDITLAAFDMMEAVAGNLVTFASFIGDTFLSVVTTLWSNLMRIGFSFTSWFRNQWTNILADIYGAFRGFISSLVTNWTVVEKMIRKMRDVEVEIYTQAWLGAKPKDPDAYRAMKRQEILAEGFKEMTGPFDKMGASSTDFKMLQDSLKHVWNVSLPQQWEQAGKDIATAFGNRFQQLNPIFAAFDALRHTVVWNELFSALESRLPEGAAGSFGKWFMQMLHPEAASDTAGMPPGGQGPGFTFKQTSESRYMLGGEAMGRIEQQQLYELRLIRGAVQELAQARGKVFENGKPPVILKENK